MNVFIMMLWNIKFNKLVKKIIKGLVWKIRCEWFKRSN